MPVVAIVAQDGTITEVLMGDTVDFPVFNERFPDTQAVLVPEGARATRGDKYDPENGFPAIVSAPAANSHQVDF